MGILRIEWQADAGSAGLITEELREESMLRLLILAI